MNTLFFGGSFDPPHVAHVLCVAYALSVGEFERAVVVPVFEHAFGKQLCPFEHRVAMCQRAFAPLRGVEVLTVEAALARPNYTLHTLQHLAREHPDWRLRLLIGSDVLLDSSKWFGFEQVSELAPPFVIERAGVLGSSASGLLPELSSTRVRELLAARGTPGADAELARLLPRAVLDYVAERGLYASAP